MYNKILIPVDGSECSLAAARHGFDLAKVHGSGVHIIYVVDLKSYGTYFDIDPKSVEDRTITTQLKEKGKEITRQAAAVADDPGIDITEVVRFGRPYKKILECASENDLDLIIMGSTGKSNLQGMVLGSVSHSVSQAANIPVTLIRDKQIQTL